MSVLVFSLAALLGFASYYLTRGNTPRLVGGRLAQPNLVALVAIGSGLGLATVLVIFVWEIHTELGTHVWHVYRFVSTPIAYCAVVGTVFGYLFGYWSSFLLKPELLTQPETNRAHGRWGLVLLTLLIVSLFTPSVDALLGRVTSINSAPLQLSFSQGQQATPQNSAGGIFGQGGEGTEDTAQQASALVRSSFYAGFAIPLLKKNAIADPFYISIVRSEPFPDTPQDLPAVLTRTEAFSSCLKEAVQGSSDPLLVHTYFGPEIHRLRLDTIDRSTHSAADIRDIAGKTIYFVEAIAKQINIPDYIQRHYIPQYIADSCIIERSSKPEANEDRISSIFEDLYESLLISFALGAAGAHEASIRALAEWIEGTDKKYKDIEQGSRAATSLQWAQIRAKQYLAISLAMEGMHTARRDLLGDVTLNMEELFFSANQQGVGAVLRDPDMWAEDRDCRALETKVREKPNFPSDWEDRSPEERPFHGEHNAAARLMLSYVSYADLFVEEALAQDAVDARVFNYAIRNAHLPSCLFTLGLSSSEQSLELQAKYRLHLAKVLLFASEFWGEKITYTTLTDLEVEKEALRHLIRAEDLLKQRGDAGDPGWYAQIVSGESGTEAMRRQIDRLIRRLTRVVSENSVP
ncbi:hypothetical protein [Amorphus sp. MBR-141]